MQPRPANDLPALRHHWPWPTRRRVIVGLVLTMALWGWFDVRVRGTVDPNNSTIHKTDFTVYTEAGAAFFDGRDPYRVTNPRGWGYLYPPLFAILVAPLHAFDPRMQVLAWFALSVLLCWGCYVECVRIARCVLPDEPDRGAFGPLAPWLGFAAVTSAALPALNCLQRGQVGVAKLFLLLLGFRLLVENRSLVRAFAAGAVLALAIVLKITPLLPVLFLLFMQLVSAWHSPAPRAPWLRFAACSGGTFFGLGAWLFLVPAMLIGSQANTHHLGTWWNSVVVRAENTLDDDFAGDNSSLRNQSFINAAHRFGNWAHYAFAGGPHDEGPQQLHEGGAGLLMDAPRVDSLLFAVRLALGCLLLVVGYRLGRAHHSLGLAAGFGLACVSTLVLSPIARGHYFVLYLPAVMFFGAWQIRRRQPRGALLYAVVPGILVVAHYALLGFAGRIGLLGLGSTAWFTAALVTVLWLSRQARTEQSPAGEPKTISRPLAARGAKTSAA